MSAATQLLFQINKFILNPLIRLMVAAALVLFLWGVVEFLGARENAEKRSSGQRHMLFGLIGLAVMLSAFGIMQLVLNTLGVDPSMVNINSGAVNLPNAQ